MHNECLFFYWPIRPSLSLPAKRSCRWRGAHLFPRVFYQDGFIGDNFFIQSNPWKWFWILNEPIKIKIRQSIFKPPRVFKDDISFFTSQINTEQQLIKLKFLALNFDKLLDILLLLWLCIQCKILSTKGFKNCNREWVPIS